MTADMADLSTMPSQDDDSEEVSVNSIHDVMALMTRRFEQLLVRQEERQAKVFAELFDVPFDKIGRSIDIQSVVVDVTEQTMSLCVDTPMWKCEVDGIYERLEREAPTYSEGGHSEASVPAAVTDVKRGTRQREPGETLAQEGNGEESLARCSDVDVSVATQAVRAREQSTDVPSDNDLHVCALPSGPVKLGEALSWQLEWYTIHGRHTPNLRSVNSVQTDKPGVDIAMSMEEIRERLCARVGVG